jgi:hypothetical protein
VDGLFGRVTLADIHQDLARNIVSLRDSQDLFDDLSDNPDDWALAQLVEDAAKPPPYVSPTPVIHRPFEDAEWFNAIGYPFRNWQASRFSDGRFGVWYGSDGIETTVYETVHHWYHGLLGDAGFCAEGVIAERKVYWVRCDAALLDFRPLATDYPDLVHGTDYSFCQTIGARLHREGHPGLATMSARCAGENFVVLNSTVLSNPRHTCYLTYRIGRGQIEIEKQVGQTWLTIPF